ncbi:hypothetical protein HMPREF1869_00519 [Bacteroidales bacterium KA00251]|nr:hypothetical protein HMPREF1869_00519 [Bacteroidales bacterium KA00251]
MHFTLLLALVFTSYANVQKKQLITHSKYHLSSIIRFNLCRKKRLLEEKKLTKHRLKD